MSKNKFSWIFAIVLLAVVPSAYAQSWTTGLGFVVINALVIGIVLFLLQSFLIPNKEGKEKTAIWVIIALTSLMVSWFYGRGGFIWNTGPLAKFFNVYLLVNALAIGTFLYIVLGLMGLKEKLSSKEGTTGYIILLFIVSVMFAFQIGNQWIWSQTTVARFINGLFGTEGILNPAPPAYRLWVFLASATLLSFFFAGYLLKGGVTGKNGLSYALAIVLAASMASEGVGLGAVIQMGEIVFAILFFQTVNETFGKDNQIMAGFAALALVAWASAAATASIPEYRGVLGGIFCKTGLIACTELAGQSAAAAGLFGWLKTLGMWALIIVAILAVLIYKIAKGEGSKKWLGIAAILAILGIILLPWWIFVLLLPFFIVIGLVVWGISKGEGKGGSLKEGATRLWNKLIKKARMNEVLAPIFGNYLEVKATTLPDELPDEFKALRVEIYTLMNFMLRHEIFKAKAGSTHNLVTQFGDINKGREKVLASHVATPETINRNMRKYIEGGKINPVKNAGGDTVGWNIDMDPETNQTSIGFAKDFYVLLKIMEDMKSDLEKSKDDLAKEVVNRDDAISKAVESKVGELDLYIDQILKYYDRFKAPVRRYRVVDLINAQWPYFLDMYNLYGVYKRGFRFAKAMAEPEYYKYELGDEVKKNDEPMWEINWDSLERISHPVVDLTLYPKNFEPHTENLIEVDMYGYSTADINRVQIEKIGLPYIRKWKNADITFVYKPDSETRKKIEATGYHFHHKYQPPRFAEVMDLAYKDWDFFVQDIERGTFHPYSRTIEDYNEIISRGSLNYDNATFKGLKILEQVAFDREALRSPGNFVYWGRKNYYDEVKESVIEEPINPYPTLSFLGLWTFITSAIPKNVKEPDTAKKYLEYMKQKYSEIDKQTGDEGGGSHGTN